MDEISEGRKEEGKNGDKVTENAIQEKFNYEEKKQK